MSDEDQEFWEAKGLEQSRKSQTADDGLDADLPEELEDLLWAFAEGRTTTDDESRLWKIAKDYPQAHHRLAQIQSAISEAPNMSEQVDPVLIWERMSRQWTAESPGALSAIKNLIVNLTSGGLKLIESSGQAAYAPAFARSENEEVSSVAQQYLTSVGNVRLTMNFLTAEVDLDSRCHLELELLARAPRFQQSDITVKLLDEQQNEIDRSSFGSKRPGFENVSSGVYSIIFICDGVTEARLLLELQNASAQE